MKTGCIKIFLSIIVIFRYTGSIYGACTFPTELRGNWISSDKGTLNFTSDTIWNYPFPVTLNVQETDFVCEEKSGDTYMLKSKSTFVLFGYNFFAYICLELHPISSYKYWYYVVNNIEPSTHLRVYVALESFTPDLSTACNRDLPFETSTFNTLVKEGALEDGLVEATCPFDIFHTFSDGTLTSSNGMISCSNSTLDVCTDRTQMRITYDPSCDTSLKLSREGMNICLLDQTNITSGITYLHVWNNDSVLAVDTMRINCYAFEKSGNVMTATLYPGACLPEQTSTEVSDPGIKVQYSAITRTCQNTVKSGPQTLYYLAIVLGAFAFLVLLVLIIAVICKSKCRCITKLCRKSRIGHSESSLTSSAEDGIEPYLRAARRIKHPSGVFVARKPLKLGPIVEPYLEPPPKVELLYDVEPRPTSSRLMFRTSVFLSQLSLRYKEETNADNHTNNNKCTDNTVSVLDI